MLSVIFIETVRGVPLVTVLFMASVMLPLFLPPGMTFDKLLRALIGVSLFASAYMAEVIRGGLQAIPKGQYEGADSLGLGYWQKMGLIVLPQALKLVIPASSTPSSACSRTRQPGVDHRHVRPARHRPQNFSDQLGLAADADVGLVFAASSSGSSASACRAIRSTMERRLDTGHKGRDRGTHGTENAVAPKRSDSRPLKDARSRPPTWRSRSSACTNGTASSMC
jgi:general L-amino acid transport system permease protein